MKTEHFVKHSTIPREKLHNKCLAWCKAGHPEPYALFVDELRPEDEKYILRASHTSVIPPINSQLQGQGLIESEYLDQSTVDKIMTIEEDCALSHLRFDLAIIEDQQSSFLSKKN
jgi:hypothetical protein